MCVAGPVRLRWGDLDIAREDDEETLTHLADLGQRRARAKSANISETPEPFDFSRLQRRKHLVASRLYGRRGQQPCALSRVSPILSLRSSAGTSCGDT